MNNIMQLIRELEDELMQANKTISVYQQDGGKAGFYWHCGYSSACIKHIQKLTLLLNAETQATVKKPEA